MPQVETLTTANAIGFLESLGLLPASRQATVVILAGQSNVLSAGYFTQFVGTGNVLDTLQPSIMRQFTRVFIFNPTTGGFELLQAGVNNLGHNNMALGPEIGLAQRWEDENPTGNLYIIKQSIPGVAISSWAPGGAGWTELSGYILTGTKALLLAGLAPIIRGFWWMQGESNGYDGLYRGKLQDLDDRLFKQKLLTVNTKLVVGMMRYDAILRAQQLAYATQNKAYVKLVDTIGYNMNPDNLHYSAKGQFLSGYTDIYNAIFGTVSAYPFPM